MTPYEQGHTDGIAGKPGPAFPRGNCSWATRLYHRGWLDGIAKFVAQRDGKEA